MIVVFKCQTLLTRAERNELFVSVINSISEFCMSILDAKTVAKVTKAIAKAVTETVTRAVILNISTSSANLT